MIELDSEPTHEGEGHAPPPSKKLLALPSMLVTVVLGIMIILPVAQLFARKLFARDVPGASSYTQRLTVWTGFLGALLASMLGRHLSMPTIMLMLKGRARLGVQIFNACVTASATVLLAYGAIIFINGERASTTLLPGGIPAWTMMTIMPLTLAPAALYTIWRAPGGWLGRILTVAACLLMVPLGRYVGGVQSLMWPGAALLIVSFLLGTPVFVAMAGLTMWLFLCGGTPISAVPSDIYGLANNEALPAIPLLTVAGYVLASGGAAKRLVAAYRALLGWMPAGMGLMVLSVCALFTAFTGASGVTILAMGGLVYPLLREENYPEGFSLGLVTASGSLGLLFPPSLPVILYAIVAQADIKALYIAGLVPGLLIIALVSIYIIVIGVATKTKRHAFRGGEAAKALWAAKWDLGLPVLVIVSIATGLAVVVEAAALAALYSVVIEVVGFRNIHPTRELPRVLASAATLVGSVVILMGAALTLSQYLVLAEIPMALTDWVQAHIKSPIVFLLAINVLLLVLGSVFEMYSAIVVLAPLLVPIAVLYEINPIHFGVVFLANLELGFLFPPMGLNLFLAATRFNKPLPQMYKHAMPFLVIMTIGVLIVTYLEPVTTGVLKLLHITY